MKLASGSQRKIYDWHIESLFGARKVYLNAHWLLEQGFKYSFTLHISLLFPFIKSSDIKPPKQQQQQHITCFYSLSCKKHKFWQRFSKSRQVEPTETSQTCENNKDRGRFVKMSAGIILIFKLSLYVQDFQEKGEAVWPHITSAHATAALCNPGICI